MNSSYFGGMEEIPTIACADYWRAMAKRGRKRKSEEQVALMFGGCGRKGRESRGNLTLSRLDPALALQPGYPPPLAPMQADLVSHLATSCPTRERIAPNPWEVHLDLDGVETKVIKHQGH
jgi:hypothetical protein